MLDEKLLQIDKALEEDDLRKAEGLTARLLKTGLSDEERAQVMLRRARTRFIRQYSEDALIDIETANDLFPSIRELAYTKALLGDIYFNRYRLAQVGFADRADTERALQFYTEVLEYSPHYRQRGWVFYQRGCVYLIQNRVAEAQMDFEAGLERDNIPASLHSFCYERLGFIALDEHRDPQAALHYLDKSIQTYPAGKNAALLVQIHMQRSRAMRIMHDYEGALTAANRALASLDNAAPNYRQGLTEAHLAIGEILANIPKREAEAIEHLLQFLQNSKRPLGVDVTWSRVYETLGDLSLRLNRHEQAIEAFQGALNFNPLHPMEVTIRYKIARCYYRLRAYEKSIEAIEKMQQVAATEHQSITDYRVYYVLGNALFALEEYKRAADAYRHARDLAPQNAEELGKITTYLRYSEELGVS
jgi:tetratricopeptide (TPR) repeat protein